MKRVVALISKSADEHEEHRKIYDIQIALSKILGQPVEIRKLYRTEPIFAIRKGYQEYRIALELAPNLVVTDCKAPQDVLFRQLGIPFLALDEQQDENAAQAVSDAVNNEDWTHGMFVSNPEGVETAKRVVILGEGVHRVEADDDALVIAMTPFQMFTKRKPDYFLSSEHIVRFPFYGDASSSIDNRWFDTVDVGSHNIPFSLEVCSREVAQQHEQGDDAEQQMWVEQLDVGDGFVPQLPDDENFWAKAIEIRNVTRSAIGVRSPNLLYSAYPVVIYNDFRFQSNLLLLVNALRNITDAPIEYRWRRMTFDLPINVVVEHQVFNEYPNTELVEADPEQNGVEFLPIAVRLDSSDIDLTRFASEFAVWLYSHREHATEQTAVAASENVSPFMYGQGFLPDTELENPAYTLTIKPAKLYPA